MSSKKQTAVEFAIEKLENLIPSGNQLVIGIILTISKEMDKQQKIEDYRAGRTDQQSDKTSKSYNRRAEQYYKETYETGN